MGSERVYVWARSRGARGFVPRFNLARRSHNGSITRRSQLALWFMLVKVVDSSRHNNWRKICNCVMQSAVSPVVPGFLFFYRPIYRLWGCSRASPLFFNTEFRGEVERGEPIDPCVAPGDVAYSCYRLKKCASGPGRKVHTLTTFQDWKITTTENRRREWSCFIPFRKNLPLNFPFHDLLH